MNMFKALETAKILVNWANVLYFRHNRLLTLMTID